jgi:hypothetical protein
VRSQPADQVGGRRQRAAAVRLGHEVRPGEGLAVRARAAGRRGPHHRDHRPRRASYDSHDGDYEAHPDASRSCARERAIAGETRWRGNKIKGWDPHFGGGVEGLQEWRF